MSERGRVDGPSFRPPALCLPPALYLIVSEDAVPPAGHASARAALLHVIDRVLVAAQSHRRSDGSLPITICLREKILLGSQLFSLAGDLVAMTAQAGAPLFINGRLDIALAVGAAGVHLPSHGIAVSDVRAAAPHLRVGLSTHDLDDVRAAKRAGADFVVYGPVFETPSKTGILQPRGLAKLAQATAVGVPVLALGGVGVGDIAACIAAGAQGVACIRAVLAAEDAAAASAAFLGGLSAELR